MSFKLHQKRKNQLNGQFDEEDLEEEFDEEEESRRKRMKRPKKMQERDSDDDEEVQKPSSQITSSVNFSYTNKQRVLVVASRGITARYRHLLEDFKLLIPHHKKDNKLDCKNDIQIVNQIAEMKSCNQVLYLETRKHQDLFMYLGKTPNGPSAKFQVVNVHTMDELKLTGNCMLGSRPLLNFDSAFDDTPHYQLYKSLLRDCFGTPVGHPKSKPFLDRIMSFNLIGNNIWVRNYQIVSNPESHKEKKEPQLIEIGPRFVLIPIRIFLGSLGGPTLYQNQSFVSPNAERSLQKKSKGLVVHFYFFFYFSELTFLFFFLFLSVIDMLEELFKRVKEKSSLN
jgi:ribosome biogenesis protein BRX1